MKTQISSVRAFLEELFTRLDHAGFAPRFGDNRKLIACRGNTVVVRPDGDEFAVHLNKFASPECPPPTGIPVTFTCQRDGLGGVIPRVMSHLLLTCPASNESPSPSPTVAA